MRAQARTRAGDAGVAEGASEEEKYACRRKQHAEGKNPKNTAVAQKFMRKTDFENSYLLIQEESGKTINRGIVAKDLSFKLI